MRDGANNLDIIPISVDMIMSPLELPMALALPSIKGCLPETISMPYIIDSVEELVGNNNEELQHQSRHINTLNELSATINFVIKAIDLVKNDPTFIVWEHVRCSKFLLLF